MLTERKKKYLEYISSPEWKAKRALTIAEQGEHCRVCLSVTKCDIHHKTYERLGHERQEDLAPVCRFCHDIIHCLVPIYATKKLFQITSKLHGKVLSIFQFTHLNKKRNYKGSKWYHETAKGIVLAVAFEHWNHQCEAILRIGRKHQVPYMDLKKLYKKCFSPRKKQPYWKHRRYLQLPDNELKIPTNADLVNLMNLDATDETNPST